MPPDTKNPLIECNDCREEFKENDLAQSPVGGELICYDCETENYFWCEACGNGDHRDYEYWSDYNECSYCESCYPEYGGENVDLNSHRNGVPEECEVEGDTFSSNEFKRMVGVEIETISPDEAEHDQPEGFRQSSDGSINDAEGYGYEYISKPMNGDHLFYKIDRMSEYLFDHNYWVNKSCGLHIHIDARDLFYKELKGILLIAKSFEKTIFSMVAKSRSGTNWCKPLPVYMTKERIMRINNDTDFIGTWYESCEEAPSFDKYNDSRYHGLNLHARVYLGTIEFRYHSGTNNATKIKNWITICQSIVQKGIELSRVIHDGSDQETWTDETKKLVLQKDDLGLEEFIDILRLRRIKQYIISRVRKFDRPVTDTDIEYINNNWSNV